MGRRARRGAIGGNGGNGGSAAGGGIYQAGGELIMTSSSAHALGYTGTYKLAVERNGAVGGQGGNGGYGWQRRRGHERIERWAG